ncbi:Rho-GTPase-activating protein 5 [Termitomyces sp. T112]|nr:hypothetical protein C0989_003502 [Termitomyces sp. Mn162]KAG5727264.1 Rho-GTPase-activating protein 5 [Termitomyces sp. T112]
MDPATLPSTPKPSLKAWLNNLSFAQRLKKETEWRPDDATPDGPVFGVPLKESLKHASVPISTATTKGDLYLWGTVPVVVAKCGNYLKNNAEVPGTFRINGSSRRTRDLQAIFEKPPEFGRKLNWALETYTTHDVASVFRRYLTHMPEPVIPHAMYHSFRDALTRSNFNENDVIATYQRLIKQMPRPNQHLLLYVLDLLSVFAQKSDRNLMTASNLAVIFRPGLISHPNHETSPKEFELSQSVLEFLIAHQDYFMLDIPSPPNGSVQSPRPQTQDAHVILSSSDEEISDLGPGNWRQISARPMSRRRTTTSREDPGIISGSGSPVSPVPEHSLARPNAHDGIRRSRTMPVRKKGVDGEDPPRVLRKQRRVLATPRDEHISRN